MKRYALLLLSFLLAACIEATGPVETNYTTLLVTKDTITLNDAMNMDSSIVALACGCRFTMSVEKFMGDTSAIHYTQRDASNGAYRVAVDVIADPSVAVGKYSARLAILSTGAKGTYRDTIEVLYTK
jgi:hypothetical protein